MRNSRSCAPARVGKIFSAGSRGRRWGEGVSVPTPTVATVAAKRPDAALSFHQWMIAQDNRSLETDDDYVIHDIARDMRDDPATGYLGNYELRKYLDDRAGSENSKIAWRAYQRAARESLASLTAAT